MTGWFDDFGTGDYSLTDYSDTGLVLAMNFDTNDDVNDYSRYGNDGTNNGATWTGDGKYNGAYEFDGIDDHIDLDSLSFSEQTPDLFTFITNIYIKEIHSTKQ